MKLKMKSKLLTKNKRKHMKSKIKRQRGYAAQKAGVRSGISGPRGH